MARRSHTSAGEPVWVVIGDDLVEVVLNTEVSVLAAWLDSEVRKWAVCAGALHCNLRHRRLQRLE